MKSRIPNILAALLVASTVPLAHSQVAPPAGLVDEPVASVSRQDDVANAVASALNADTSLKHSKITVQPDGGTILLTGSSLTEAQRMRATQIASQHAGEGKVVNTISHDENVVAVPSPPAATLEVAEGVDEVAEDAVPAPTTNLEQKP